MQSTKRTRQRDLAAQAYEQLRQLIVWGQLAPGTRIIESDVADRLGMSRTPVRGALQRLLAEGYLVCREPAKQSRLSVAPLTAEDGNELFRLVGQLEGFALYLAAELPGAERSRLARELRDINQRLRDASADPEPEPSTIFELHTRFHQCCIDAAAGPRLRFLHQWLTPQAERYRRVYTTALRGNIQPSLEEHQRIIACLEAGEPDAAAQAARENWRNAAGRLSRIIEVIGERGCW